MPDQIPNPWETTSKEGLVSVGSYSLYLSTCGPVRESGAPVTIYFTGGGVPVAFHTRLRRLIGDHSRTYFYDRAGYDRSGKAPVDRVTSMYNSTELRRLLQAVNVDPPYILIAHSYGGIVARSFLELFSDAVAGMLLVDCATELMYELWPKIPAQELDVMTKGIDFIKITHLKEDSQLTDVEWEELLKAVDRTVPGADAEDNRAGGSWLAKRQQFQRQILGDRPLCVIRTNAAMKDYKLWYDVGIRHGNGSKEERERALRFIESYDTFDDQVKAAQLRLSSNTRYTAFMDIGHDIVVRNPELVVDELKWILEQF